MEKETTYYLMGLDAGSQWRRVMQWDADGKRIWPMTDKAQAIAEAVEFKEMIPGTGWQDAMLERVVSTFVSIELDKIGVNKDELVILQCRFRAIECRLESILDDCTDLDDVILNDVKLAVAHLRQTVLHIKSDINAALSIRKTKPDHGRPNDLN